MNYSSTKIHYDSSKKIKAGYQLLKKKQPNIRARKAAEELCISEGELLASRVGEDTIRLVNDAKSILKALLPLGEVMALTRNESCVHERKGIYDNCEFLKHGKIAIGLFVNPDIDLRLFMDHWKYCFATIEQTRGGARKSLQFFDKEGTALHKIYLTSKSNEVEYDKLVEEYCHERQDNFIEIEAYKSKAAKKDDDEIDWAAFRTAWKNLKDTHDFHPMLRKFKVGREQSFSKIGQDFAFEVEITAVRRVLELVRDKNCEIMIFVGNRGCIQIHSGPVKKLLEHGQWYNVLDPMFNLHLREDHIASTWVTKKPTENGIVTALEIFNKNGEIIVTFFGKSKSGSPEPALWREIIAEIPAKELTNAS